MKKTYLLLTFCCLLIKPMLAQDGDLNTAHFRMINTALLGTVDSRIPAFLLTPKADILLMKGKLVVGGHYHIELSKFDRSNRSYINSNTVLESKNMNKAFGGYELYGGYNFFSHYKEDAQYISVFRVGYANMGGGATKMIKKEEGDRAMHLGGHIGFGSINTNVSYGNNSFNLQDPSGRVYQGFSDSIGGKPYPYNTVGQTQVRYLFPGVHFWVMKKPYSLGDKVWGGKALKLYADLIMPVSVNVDDFYYNNIDRFVAVVKSGTNWKKIGYRFGVSKVGSGTFSTSTKLEIGRMTAFHVSGSPQSIFVNLGVGVAIAPKYSPYSID